MHRRGSSLIRARQQSFPPYSAQTSAGARLIQPSLLPRSAFQFFAVHCASNQVRGDANESGLRNGVCAQPARTHISHYVLALRSSFALLTVTVDTFLVCLLPFSLLCSLSFTHTLFLAFVYPDNRSFTRLDRLSPTSLFDKNVFVQSLGASRHSLSLPACLCSILFDAGQYQTHLLWLSGWSRRYNRVRMLGFHLCCVDKPKPPQGWRLWDL